MKIIFTSLVMAATFMCRAQAITIFSASAVDICPGYGLMVSFKYDGSAGSSQINLKNDTTTLFWLIENDSIYKYAKTVVSGDTVYTVPLFMPNYWSDGQASVTADWQTYWPVSFKCFYTGIKEHLNNSLLPKEYFDLNGNKIEPKAGILMIEMVGGKRRKVFIQD
jgi:hypothetical protein